MTRSRLPAAHVDSHDQDPYPSPSDLGSRRHVVAKFVIASVLVFPIAATPVSNSVRVNLISGGLMLMLPLVLFPWFRESLRAAVQSRITIAGLLMLAFVSSWTIQSGMSWANGQLMLYASIGLAFPILVRWFRHSGSSGLPWVYWMKMFAILLVAGIYLLAIATTPGDRHSISTMIGSPPIYRNARHMNYELFMVAALGFYFASLSARAWQRIFWVLFFILVGYLMFWSGGRAMMLTMALFVAILYFCSVLPKHLIGTCSAGIGFGGVLVVVSGKGGYLLAQAERIQGTWDQAASGRFVIWGDSLSLWFDSPLAVMFGSGPDTFRISVKEQIGTWVIQPHNALVQVVLEFGVIGLLVLLLLAFYGARQVLADLRIGTVPAAQKVVSSTLACSGVYAMLDGLLYHALPLTFIAFLLAFRVSQAPLTGRTI